MAARFSTVCRASVALADTRGRAIRPVLAAALALLVLALPVVPAVADRVDDLARSLEQDRDEKARIAAAVGLGRLADPRGVPALMRALADPSAVVRGVAATALGHIGDGAAIPALERSLSDDNELVRNRAREALSLLRDKPSVAPILKNTRVAPKERPRLSGPRNRPHVAVKTVTDHSRKGGSDLPKRMRGVIEKLIDDSPQVALSAEGGPVKPHYFVDASITELSRATQGPWVEVSCQVRIAVSTGEGRILSIVTGGAKVQTPRRLFRPKMERSLQVDALDNALRGAFENLLTFLSRQIASK